MVSAARRGGVRRPGRRPRPDAVRPGPPRRPRRSPPRDHRVLIRRPGWRRCPTGRWETVRRERRLTQPPYRSGFVALVGRPNAGKTTLTNALVGEKVGIVSNRPQTTRHAIRGVVHRPDGQMVLVDTPGLHKPKSLLGQRLNDVVRDTLSDVDVIVFCVPADQPVGAGDAFIARQLREVRAPVVVVVTKTDAASKKAGRRAADRRQPAGRGRRGGAGQRGRAATRSSLLEELLIGLLPEGPPLYPEDADHRRGHRAADRRAGPRGGAGEGAPGGAALPGGHRRGDHPPARPAATATADFVELHALLHVERASQKPMLLGKGGRRSRRSAARPGSAWRPARRPGAPGAARHGAGGVAGRPEEAQPAGLLSEHHTEGAVPRRGRRPAHAEARRGRPDRHRAHPPARQGAGGRQGRAAHQEQVRRPAGAVQPRRPAALHRPQPRHRQPGRVDPRPTAPTIVADYPAYTAGTAVLETADRLTAEEKEPAASRRSTPSPARPA